MRLLLHGCIVVRLAWLTGGSTPDDKKKTDDYRQTRISWSNPATEPDSRIILPSDLHLRSYPILKTHVSEIRDKSSRNWTHNGGQRRGETDRPASEHLRGRLAPATATTESRITSGSRKVKSPVRLTKGIRRSRRRRRSTWVSSTTLAV